MSTVADKIAAREFIVTTELTPPKGVDLADVFAKADALRGCVDAFNLTESPRARMTIAPVAVGRLMLERGLEPIVQVTARDRNRIAIQADLLGAAALPRQGEARPRRGKLPPRRKTHTADEGRQWH
jgi:methylenetetrahydrofolate reductase (NADPH)